MLSSPITTTKVGTLTKRTQRPTSSIYRSSLSTANELVEVSVAHEVTNTGIVNSVVLIDNNRIITDSTNLGKPERIRVTFKVQYKDLSIRDDRDTELASMIAAACELMSEPTFLAGFLGQEA